MCRRLITPALAFDDQTSTFIIPSGAGFEVVFCPGARSTIILDTSMEEMLQLAQHGQNKQQAMILKRFRQEMFKSIAPTRTARPSTVLVVAILVVMLCMLSRFG